MYISGAVKTPTTGSDSLFTIEPAVIRTGEKYFYVRAME